MHHIPLTLAALAAYILSGVLHAIISVVFLVVHVRVALHGLFPCVPVSSLGPVCTAGFRHGHTVYFGLPTWVEMCVVIRVFAVLRKRVEDTVGRCGVWA